MAKDDDAFISYAYAADHDVAVALEWGSRSWPGFPFRERWGELTATGR